MLVRHVRGLLRNASAEAMLKLASCLLLKRKCHKMYGTSSRSKAKYDGDAKDMFGVFTMAGSLIFLWECCWLLWQSGNLQSSVLVGLWMLLEEACNLFAFAAV